MSASELASFVAAVIDDGIAPELKRKIDALESTIQNRDHARLLVQITGRHGRPIYGEASLQDGMPTDDVNDDDTLWSLLDLQDEEDVFICPFDEESLQQLEIRVGGNLIMSRFSDLLVVIDGFDYEEHQDEEDLDKLVYWDHVCFRAAADYDETDCPIYGLSGRVGPITVRQYKTLCERSEPGIEIPTSDLFEHNVATTSRNMTLTVEEINFLKNNISGSISLMKQLGIRTLRSEILPRIL